MDRWGGALVARFPGLMRRLARLETACLEEEIARVAIDRPVYIAGMARSGTTVLLEALADAPGFTSLRYSDFPWQWLPYWWNWLRDRLPLPAPQPAERAHRDRLLVTPLSPEAFEEGFWQAFFPGRHDESLDQTLDERHASGEFGQFYRCQIRKLLAVRNGRRYLCKGNYNLLRLRCLLAMFPDARFILPVRAPLAHVASLVKQDRWFTEWSLHDPRIAVHLSRLGHHEFGPFKRVQHCGDPEAAQAVRAAWDAGDIARGYALQWREIYEALLRDMLTNDALRRACCVVFYEDLCAQPAAALRRIAQHAQLADNDVDALVQKWQGQLKAPDYYASDFDPATRETIESITDGTWKRLDERFR